MTRFLSVLMVVALGASAGCASAVGAGRDRATRTSSAPTSTKTTASRCTPARPVHPTNMVQHFAYDGHDRTYLLAVPADDDGTAPRPLIFDFHGWGSKMETFEAETRLGRNGAARGVYVVTPQALGNPTRWNWDSRADGPDDFGFVHALLADLEQRLCVDAARVYAAGHSNGAAFAGFLPCKAPYEFAAAVSASATVPSSCPDGVTPSMLTVRGTADPQVLYDGAAVDGAVATWVKQDGCATTPRRDEPIDGVQRVRYDRCEQGAEVVLDTILGGVHVWAGSQAAQTKPGNSEAGRRFPATTDALDFFAGHLRTWGPKTMSDQARPCETSTVAVTERTVALPEQTLNNGWSPDSKRIAFADRSVNSPVMILDLPRGSTRAITAPMHAVAPTWASNGRIYFSSRPDGGGEGRAQNLSHHTPPDMYVVDAGGSHLQRIELTAPHPEGNGVVYWDSSAPAKFSPDGTKIGLSTLQGGNWVMFVGAIARHGHRLRVDHLEPVNAPDGRWYEVKAFSRDGATLLFGSDRDTEPGRPPNSDVYTMSLADRRVTRYTTDPAWEETMDLSPHGNVAVISSDRAHPLTTSPTGTNATDNDQAGGGLARHDLYLSGPRGDRGPFRRLTFDGDDGWDNIRPRWSPDGRHISVSQRHAGDERVEVLTLSCAPSRSDAPAPTAP
jgi:polyhydroxybutyrate depolymerase